MPAPTPDPHAAFDDSADTSTWWLAAVAALPDTAWRQDDEVWTLAAACPRCTHTFSKDLSPVQVTAFRRAASPDQVYVACNCLFKHEGRPDGASGCGPAGFIPWPKRVPRSG